jgi:putative ABC transport system ATP-binding protein
MVPIVNTQDAVPPEPMSPPRGRPPRTSRRSRSVPTDVTPTDASPRRASVMASIVRTHRGTLAWALPLALLNEGIEMLVPILLGQVIDHGIVAGSLLVTLLGALAIVVLRVIGVFSWSAMFKATARARMYERHRVRVAVTGAVLDPRSKPIRRPAGEVLSIATSDADKASDVLDMLPWAFPASIVLVGSFAWMTVLDPWLGIANLIGLVIMVVVIYGITPVLSARYDTQQSRAADAAAIATDLVHGLRVLQGLGVQSRARKNYRGHSRVALDAALVNARYSGVSSGLTTLITAFMLAATVIIAARQTLAGALSIGTLIAVVGVARSTMGMMQGLSGVPVWWASMSTSGRRVRNLLGDLGRTIDDPELGLDFLSSAHDDRGESRRGERRGPAGGLRLRALRSGTLRGLDLEVDDGRVVALACADARDSDAVVGSVSGHVSTADEAVEDPGTVLVGDTAVTVESRFGIRADLLVEPHVVDLFDGTVREQLSTRAPDGTPTDGSDDTWADAALHAAGAEDLLRILPDGYDSRILDRGANLSGGQRQRIALARAVASDAPVLVLHDPTTAVDAVTEQNIAEALVAARHEPDRATLLVTHAPSLLQAADQVVYVRGGVEIAHGHHEELMELDSYREMVQR